jgi:methyl-accepting chemotaxis protein/methyl-accepting chemotaxis protein-1 (serine sensor receptor)
MAQEWSLRTRLTASSAALVAASMLLGAVSLIAIRHLSKTLHDTAGRTSRQVEIATGLQADFEQMRSAAHAGQISIVIELMDKGSGREGQCIGCHDKGMIEASREEFRAASRDVQKNLELFARLGPDAEQAKHVASLRRGLEEWMAAEAAYHSRAGTGAFDDAHALVTEKIFPLVQASAATAEKLQSAAKRFQEASVREADSEARQANAAMMGIALVTLIVGVRVALCLRRAGKKLTGVVVELDQSARTVVNSGSNLAQTSQALARSAGEQERALQETAAENREVTALARSNSSDASHADEAMARTAARTAEAREALQQMVGAMNGVEESSGKIASIIKIIDGIAFQTNILALNAAVEAARAGETGLGFAVVANEVRSLAARCAEAAKETAGLIDELHKRASEGHGRVKSAVDAVDAIAGDAQQVRTLVAQVKTGSGNQTAGMDRLSHSLSSIESVTAQTARSADESAAESEELNQTSARLSETIGELSRLVGV